MPKTLFQNVIFTLMMSFLMVYVMICYNICLNVGGMSNEVFLMAFGELKIMWPAAFVLEFAFVDKLAHMLAFRIVTPQDRPIFITLAIFSMIVCIMCPCMSLVATILFKNAGSNVIATWCQTTFMNFPVAFFWQIFYCGPFIRLIFRKMFPEKEKRCRFRCNRIIDTKKPSLFLYSVRFFFLLILFFLSIQKAMLYSACYNHSNHQKQKIQTSAVHIFSHYFFR